MYQYHLDCTDPIQEKSITKVTEPLQFLISRDMPSYFSSRTPTSVELALLTIYRDVIPSFQILTDANSQVRCILYFSECDPFQLVTISLARVSALGRHLEG